MESHVGTYICSGKFVFFFGQVGQDRVRRHNRAIVRTWTEYAWGWKWGFSIHYYERLIFFRNKNSTFIWSYWYYILAQRAQSNVHTHVPMHSNCGLWHPKYCDMINVNWLVDKQKDSVFWIREIKYLCCIDLSEWSCQSWCLWIRNLAI